MTYSRDDSEIIKKIYNNGFLTSFIDNFSEHKIEGIDLLSIAKFNDEKKQFEFAEDVFKVFFKFSEEVKKWELRPIVFNVNEKYDEVEAFIQDNNSAFKG